MGGFLAKPVTEKHCESGEGNGLRFALCSMQGWRTEMEDFHTALPIMQTPFDKWSFFGVFDGHAGKLVSKHCAGNLLHFVTETKEFAQLTQDADNLSPDARSDCIKRGLLQGFFNFDDFLRKMPEIVEREDDSGSTAICALICPEVLYLVNCGDSRGLVVSNKVVALATCDHKPDRPMERERIERAGGKVEGNRVNGSLGVSRGFGDFTLKEVAGLEPAQQPVTAEAEVFELIRSPDDEFIVLACDGVWDVMTNENVCEFILYQLTVEEDFEIICEKLVDLCLKKGSRDNISVILLVFPGAPGICEESQRREKLLRMQEEELVATIDVAIEDVLAVRMSESEAKDIETLTELVTLELLKTGVSFPHGSADMRGKVTDKLKVKLKPKPRIPNTELVRNMATWLKKTSSANPFVLEGYCNETEGMKLEGDGQANQVNTEDPIEWLHESNSSLQNKQQPETSS